MSCLNLIHETILKTANTQCNIGEATLYVYIGTILILSLSKPGAYEPPKVAKAGACNNRVYPGAIKIQNHITNGFHIWKVCVYLRYL